MGTPKVAGKQPVRSIEKLVSVTGVPAGQGPKTGTGGYLPGSVTSRTWSFIYSIQATSFWKRMEPRLPS
jgi:hypothetical protein